jgi:putative DNA primase/helicase
MYGNHKPEIRGADEGIWRRVRLIPFVVQIPEKRRDKQLKAVLAEELPGILRWAIEGTQRWLAEGMEPPAGVMRASAEYREEEDTLADFIAVEIEADASARVDTGSMFARYQSWAEKTGVRFALAQRTLTRRLKERGLKWSKSNGEAYWLGVSLK